MVRQNEWNGRDKYSIKPNWWSRCKVNAASTWLLLVRISRTIAPRLMLFGDKMWVISRWWSAAMWRTTKMPLRDRCCKHSTRWGSPAKDVRYSASERLSNFEKQLNCLDIARSEIRDQTDEKRSRNHDRLGASTICDANVFALLASQYWVRPCAKPMPKLTVIPK